MSNSSRVTDGGDLDIAIAHDQMHAIGGAERVAVEMARLFDAPIYAMRVDHRVVPDDVEVRNVSSRLGTLAMSSHYLVQDMYQFVAWQHVEELYDHDVIVQNKTNPMWFVPKDDQTVVRYLHSPPRGMYDQFYRRGSGLLSRLVKFPQRPLFQPNVATADAWAVNSDLVQRRADLYWGVDAEVVYPPVDVERFGRSAEPTGDYYAVVSRLQGHKRVSQAVRAANAMDAELRVAGSGPELETLREMAGPTVEVLGYVDEAEKARLLSGAKAMLMTAENEDFGMAPVEALASGTPVIGADEGFTRHQIIEGANGLLYDGTARDLETSMSMFERDGVDWPEERIEGFADRFTASKFRDKMARLVARAVENSRVEVPWSGASGLDSDTRPIKLPGGDD